MLKLNNKAFYPKFLYFNLGFLFLTFINFGVSSFIATKASAGQTFVSPVLNIVYAQNTGAAFSLMQNSAKVLIALSFIAIFAVFIYVIKYLSSVKISELIFLSFLLAGIIGNLAERMFLGYVRDFFELAFVNFPIFNISDIFINIGVLGIILLILLDRKS